MAFMRGKYYIWEEDDTINNWTKSLPLKIFDALVLMRMAELITIDKKSFKSALKTALQYQGNFGCDALCKLQKKVTASKMIKLYIKILKKTKLTKSK